MIEFKAECGHTVRAKDEEAGGSVRCSYCGRASSVPSPNDEPPDSLFDEVQRSENTLVKPPKGRRGGRRAATGGGRKPGALNPFPVILRLCYAALLISIVIIITRKFVLPMWSGWKQPPQAVAKTDDAPAKKARDGMADTPRPVDKGLLQRSQLAGLYVTSTPPGATVLCVPAADAPPTGRINRQAGCIRYEALSTPPRLGDGNYVVELVMPWNHRDLKKYQGYKEFRQDLERSPDNLRKQLVENYFLADEAVAVFFDQTEEQKYIVRQYRGVEIRDGRSAGVRGLFLPRIETPDSRLDIEQLVLHYIPEAINYAFDDRDVRDELEYYGVTVADQPWMLKALARIGLMPYVTANRRVLVFKIGLEDGVFSAKVMREPGK